jgi:hypothetical protein
MTEHPAVAWLRQAHERAEGLAQAATPGPWEPKLSDDDEVCTVLGAGGGLVGYPVAYVRAEVRGCWRLDEDRTRANARLIVLCADPAAALRRVGFEREILVEHSADGWGQCSRCQDEEPVANRGTALDWPCRTVLLLAKAWGWGWEERS